MNFNETFFFFLVWIFSTTKHEKRHCINVIWLIWILNYVRLKTSWFFVHWFANWIYFWTCFANKLSSWKQITFLKFLRSSYDEYTIHALFFDNLLWNSRNVNSFQFQWTKTIIYRVIYDEMFVANFWFMFACLNFVKMFCYDIIFCNFWFVRMFCNIFIFVHMFKFWIVFAC